MSLIAASSAQADDAMAAKPAVATPVRNVRRSSADDPSFFIVLPNPIGSSVTNPSPHNAEHGLWFPKLSGTPLINSNFCTDRVIVMVRAPISPCGGRYLSFTELWNNSKRLSTPLWRIDDFCPAGTALHSKARLRCHAKPGFCLTVVSRITCGRRWYRSRSGRDAATPCSSTGILPP